MYQKSKTLLLYSIHSCIRVGWYPVTKDGSIASLEQNAQPASEVPDWLSLLLSCVAGQCRPQLLHLVFGHIVPSHERLRR